MCVGHSLRTPEVWSEYCPLPLECLAAMSTRAKSCDLMNINNFKAYIKKNRGLVSSTKAELVHRDLFVQ